MAIRLAFLALFLLLPGLASAEAGKGPVVFAAASLRGVLERASAGLHPAPRIAYGGSGALAQQIARGAPADLVILASQEWMDWLAARGAVRAPLPLLGGRLVLVGRGGPALGAPDAAGLLARLDGGRLAMGQRRAVPAGVYAQAWLQSIGAWDTLRPHLAEAQDVRAALVFVVQGAAPLGVVYASDAQAEPRVQVLYQIPPGAHPPIRYPAAALSPAGAAFLAHLQRRPDIFAEAGFEVLW